MTAWRIALVSIVALALAQSVAGARRTSPARDSDALRKRQGDDRDERDPPRRWHRFLQPPGSTFGGSPGVDKAWTMPVADST